MSHATIQPAWVRITHWINALAVVLMVTSGWHIYDASPIFPVLRFPSAITLGGWLGGALQWHFAIMWMLVANFLVYIGLNFASGRLRRKLLPISFKSHDHLQWERPFDIEARFVRVVGMLRLVAWRRDRQLPPKGRPAGMRRFEVLVSNVIRLTATPPPFTAQHQRLPG